MRPVGQSAISTRNPTRQARPRNGRIPLWLFFLAAIGALALGGLSILVPAVGLITLVICISLAIIIWTSRLSDPMVVALALVIFWLPFHTTVSRWGISPQEVAVYGIWLFGVLLSPLGIRRWLLQVITSLSPLMQLAFLLFALACLQSVLRIKQLDIVTTITNLRMALFYPLLLALLVAYAIRTRRCVKLLLWAFVAGGVCFGVYALGLRLWGVDIANGAVAGRLGAEESILTGYHPNNLGLYLTLALSFMPALFLEAWIARRARLVKLLAALAGAASMGLALWLTYSRGALLALLLGFAVIGLARLWLSGTRQRLIGLGLVALGGIAFGGFIAWQGVGSLGRYAGLFDASALSSDPDVQFRASLYTRAIAVATQHVFSGIGFGSFAQGADVPFSPHNTYLDLWVSAGIVAALAFIIAMLLGIVSAFRAARRFHVQRQQTYVLYMLGLAGALIAFLAQAFVENFDQQPRIAPTVWVLAAFAHAALLALSAQRKAQHVGISQPQDVPSAQRDSEPSPEQRQREEKMQEEDAQGTIDNQDAQGATDDQPALPSAQPDLFDGLDTGPQLAMISLWEVDTQPLPIIPPRGSQTKSIPAAPNMVDVVPATEPAPSPNSEQARAERLVQRAPASYLWNQLYALWFFAANFLLSIILTHGLSKQEYGVFAILSTVLSTLVVIFAFGLEDTATVFLPRVLARDGQSSAGKLIARLLTIRIMVLGGVSLLLSVGFLAALPLLTTAGLAPALLGDSSHQSVGVEVTFMAVYLVGNSFVALENAIFASLLRSRATFIIGGGCQLLNLLATVALLYAGYGINGVFAALGIVAWLNGISALVALIPLLRHRSKRKIKGTRRMRKLAVNAWLVNVTNSALGKQMDIVLMTAFAVSYMSIGYYNLAYQLSNVVGLLLISGLGGVGIAAMSAALSAGGRERLASIWRASLMLQVLFAVPLQILCLVRANQLVDLLYGAQYAGAVPLFRVFLAFAIFGRLIGGGSNQSALYVVGRQRTVLIVRWAGFVLNVVLDVALIPRYGPAGPLIGTGFSQNWVGLVEYLLMRKELPARYPGEFARRVVGSAIVPAMILLWWTPSGIIGLAGSVILFLVLLIAGLLTLRAGEAGDLDALLKANPRLQKLISVINRRLPAWMSGAQAVSSQPMPETP